MDIDKLNSRNRVFYLNRIKRKINCLSPLGLKLLSRFLDILLQM